VQDSRIERKARERFQVILAVLDRRLAVAYRELFRLGVDQNTSGITDRAMKIEINKERKRDRQQSRDNFHSRFA
jgi:hypothetical protein